jgi:hypothetical protein
MFWMAMLGSITFAVILAFGLNAFFTWLSTRRSPFEKNQPDGKQEEKIIL